MGAADSLAARARKVTGATAHVDLHTPPAANPIASLTGSKAAKAFGEALANAVTNAIGVRVTEWPMSPRNVLNALATASKEGKA